MYYKNMSKTTSKKATVKTKASVKKTAVTKPSHATKSKSNQITIDRNVLLFLVLTLVLAGIMLIIQAQSNNTLSEQNKAQSALEYETDSK